MSRKDQLIGGFLNDTDAKPYLELIKATGQLDASNPDLVRALRIRNSWLRDVIAVYEPEFKIDDRLIEAVSQSFSHTEQVPLKWARKMVELALKTMNPCDTFWENTFDHHGIIDPYTWTQITTTVTREFLSVRSEEELIRLYHECDLQPPDTTDSLTQQTP